MRRGGFPSLFLWLDERGDFHGAPAQNATERVSADAGEGEPHAEPKGGSELVLLVASVDGSVQWSAHDICFALVRALGDLRLKGAPQLVRKGMRRGFDMMADRITRQRMKFVEVCCGLHAARCPASSAPVLGSMRPLLLPRNGGPGSRTVWYSQGTSLRVQN